MFEASLVGFQRRKGARRWLSLPLAVALHLVALSSLVFAQYWNVDRVPEPQVNDVFQVALPPPPPPLAARRGTVAPQPARHTAPAVIPDHPAQPAPPTIESDRPAPAPAPAGDDAQVGVPGGIDQGDPAGEPGGDPNGATGGVRGSVAPPQAPPQPEEAVRYRGDMTRPQILLRVPPQYTEVARQARLQGTVIVEAVIDEGGRVRDVHILKGLPLGLDRAALDAVAQWRFTPATLNGRPLKVIYTLTLNFVVQ